MASIHNNYIIGLGGTGGDSVAAFRRALAGRAYEASELEKKNVKFHYLYIDSNSTDIQSAQTEESSGKWAIPGKPVNLKAADCLLINADEGLDPEQVRMHANIAPWYGDTRGVKLLIVKGKKLEGAEQRRRFGRMLLARQAGALKRTIAAGKNELKREPKRSNVITYHIFATLGGGTGSGSIVDMVTYLYANEDKKPEIYLYLYVGGSDETIVQGAVAATNQFYMNEYSALRDLNALMTGRYKPDMAASSKINDSYEISDSPIKAIFISSEQSERTLDLPAQVDNMANACLDIISLFNSVDSSSNNARPFSGEDIVSGQPGEISPDDTWNSSQQREPKENELCERSYRFQTISVSRCKEPVREIETILKCALAEQVINRLLNGANQLKALTYEKNLDIYHLNKQIAGGELDLDHTEYREKTLKQIKKWEPSATNLELDTLTQLTHNTIEMVQTIQMDAKLASQESLGVDTEMQTKCKDEATKLREFIEKKLKNRRDWSKSQVQGKIIIWGIEDIITYLTNLTTRLSEEINKEFTFSQTYGNLEKRHSEWNKICGLTDLLTDKQDDMYELHYQEARAIITRACKEREDMIRRLVWKELINELNALINNMKEAKKNLLLEKKKQNELENNVKKTIEDFSDSKNISYIYDEDKLKKHRSYYTDNDDQLLSKYMSELDRSQHTTGALSLRQSIPNVVDLDVDKEKEKDPDSLSFWNRSRAIHVTLYKDSSKDYEPAYHANIYEALRDLENSDVKKYNKILELLKNNLDPSASIDSSPFGGKALTTNTFPSPYSAIQFGRPEIENLDKNTIDKIDNAINDKVSHMASDATRYRTFLLNDIHELRILYTIYWMPVRLFSFMKCLHDNYHCNGLDESTRRTNLYYSNIDDKDDQKPDLVPQNVSPRAHECRLYFTIATQLIVTQLPDSSEHMLAYEKEAANGVEYHVYTLGEDKKLDTEMIHYEKYTANQMAEGSDALYQHLQNAVHAWFALAKADPQAVLNAMTEKYNEMREKTGKKHSREKELQYAAYNEFKELISYFSTL